MEGWKKGLWETICQPLEITITSEGVLFLFLAYERWVDVSLTAGVTDTVALRPDELLSLFALLILLSTVAIQIRAHGPLGSQEGGQPILVAQVCIRVCMCCKIDIASHSGDDTGLYEDQRLSIRTKCPNLSRKLCKMLIYEMCLLELCLL